MHVNSTTLLMVLFGLAMLPAPILFLIFWRLRKEPIESRRRWGARLMVTCFGLALAFLVPTAIVRGDVMQVIPFGVAMFIMWAAWKQKLNLRVMWTIHALVGIATTAYGAVATTQVIQGMIAKPVDPQWLGWGLAGLLALLTWLSLGGAAVCIWMARKAPVSGFGARVSAS